MARHFFSAGGSTGWGLLPGSDQAKCLIPCTSRTRCRCRLPARSEPFPFASGHCRVRQNQPSHRVWKGVSPALEVGLTVQLLAGSFGSSPESKGTLRVTERSTCLTPPLTLRSNGRCPTTESDWANFPAGMLVGCLPCSCQ